MTHAAGYVNCLVSADAPVSSTGRAQDGLQSLWVPANPCSCFGHAASRMRIQRLLIACAKANRPRCPSSEDSRGATTPQGSEAWRDQKTLRTTSCLRVFSGPCPSCSSRVESASHPGQWLHQCQPYVYRPHRPHRHKRILPGRDSASKQPFCLALGWSQIVPTAAATAQLATRGGCSPSSSRKSTGGTARAIELGSNTAAT